MSTLPLDTFDHVVVLMLENRSFDNLLGYLYPNQANFDGVAGKNLSNPDPQGVPVPVSVGTNYHQPFPDPGEEFDHITTQVFGEPPAATPVMTGFVRDYYDTLTKLKDATKWPGSPAAQCPAIMKCFAPPSLPVLSGLAQEFAVFDHWFCAVPSQTWTNRAFWHAAMSWGWVNNPGLSGNPKWNLENYLEKSATGTLFDQIETKFGKGSWHIYSDLGTLADAPSIAFTKIVHFGDLIGKNGEDYFRYLDRHPLQLFKHNFFDDCAEGKLPKYSFLEPHFMNFVEDGLWHNDMHPSSYDSPLYSDDGPGSVLLGDQLIWRVYQAIRNSHSKHGNNWQNTLFIITFDEHGGCYDHVSPPGAIPPVPGIGQDGFDFGRLGVRVPMVMVSAHIAKNTIVNTPMHHCSFLRTMQAKWELGAALSPRQATAPEFTEVFSDAMRSHDSWPDWKKYPGPSPILDDASARTADASKVPLNDLQASIANAIQKIYAPHEVLAFELKTAQDVRELMQRIKLSGAAPR